MDRVQMENAHANEVLPRLWLGDYHASQDETFLRGNHIDVVFNCTKDLPFSPLQNLVFYRVPLDDNLEEVEIRNAGLWSSITVLEDSNKPFCQPRILQVSSTDFILCPVPWPILSISDRRLPYEGRP